MLPRVKRRLRNFIATLVRDRRGREPYTYHWLNGLCGTIVTQSEAAEIRPHRMGRDSRGTRAPAQV